MHGKQNTDQSHCLQMIHKGIISNVFFVNSLNKKKHYFCFENDDLYKSKSCFCFLQPTFLLIFLYNSITHYKFVANALPSAQECQSFFPHFAHQHIVGSKHQPIDFLPFLPFFV